MFIRNWRQAWRWWSVRVSVLGLLTQLITAAQPDLLLGLWNMMPGEVRALVPAHFATWIGVVLFAGVLLGRLIPQKEKIHAE